MRLVTGSKAFRTLVAKSGMPCSRSWNAKQAKLSNWNKFSALSTPPVRLATFTQVKVLTFPRLPKNLRVWGYER